MGGDGHFKELAFCGVASKSNLVNILTDTSYGSGTRRVEN